MAKAKAKEHERLLKAAAKAKEQERLAKERARSSKAKDSGTKKPQKLAEQDKEKEVIIIENEQKAIS